MMSLFKKRSFVGVGLVLSLFLLVGVFGAMQVFAGNDNVAFDFAVKQGLTRPKTRDNNGRYRGTTNPRNSWKVNLLDSDESGGSTKTTFWIERYNGTRVSNTHTILEDSGAHYFSASSDASQATVYLGAQDNDINILPKSSYRVSGYWDEETGQLVN